MNHHQNLANLKSIPAQSSLDTLESSSINKNFPANNLFLEAALDLSFKQVILFQVGFQGQNESRFHLYLLLVLL